MMTTSNHVEHRSIDWLDAVRWLATIAVITIHVVAPYLYQYGQISIVNWNIYNVIDSLSRFAVPFFVMLSGALLLNRTISLVDFLKKRFLRILIPFLFWSLIYSTYHFLKSGVLVRLTINRHKKKYKITSVDYLPFWVWRLESYNEANDLSKGYYPITKQQIGMLTSEDSFKASLFFDDVKSIITQIKEWNPTE